MASEHTPLLASAASDPCDCDVDADCDCECAHPAPRWQCWRMTSPMHRFFLLALISCIPFGGHFVKNSMSSLQPLMLDDAVFPVSNTMYGALLSVVSVPNLLIPLVGGHMLDSHGHRTILLFLVWICVGHAVFALGMQLHCYWLALLGRVFFGIGEGSVVVGARVLIAFWFRRSELTFAMGVAVAVTNVSKMLAKATVAPIALCLGGYVHALWYGTVICGLSVFAGSAACACTKRLQSAVQRCVRLEQPLDESLQWLTEFAADSARRKRQHLEFTLSTKPHQQKKHQPMSCGAIGSLSRLFWLLTTLHVLFITVFHLFQNISSSYLAEQYGYSVVKSGLISALSHAVVIFAPVIGLCVDHFGGRVYWIVASAVLAVLAYSLLLLTTWSPPVVSMLLMSICLSFTPTIINASIAKSLARNHFGTAFGIVEIAGAAGATVGNLLMGLSRDLTGSYDADMYMLLTLAMLTLGLSIALVVLNRRRGHLLSMQQRVRSISMDDDEPPPVIFAVENATPARACVPTWCGPRRATPRWPWTGARDPARANDIDVVV